MSHALQRPLSAAPVLASQCTCSHSGCCGDSATVQAEPPIRKFGIAKKAPARQRSSELPEGSLVVLWTLDSTSELRAACREGADIVITNRPLRMLAEDILP